MKCKKCGTKLDKDSLFCEGCGEAVKKKSKTPLYISLIAGISVLAVVAIVLIFNHVSGAYDWQIELGYELLNDGKYEEAILAFDKAIEIEEKRPEGYMGKAESMAHDPEMTPEKAEEIVKVLEEGYKKSGDKKVLEHKKKVGEILQDNGFDVEAGIVNKTEASDTPKEKANEFELALCMLIKGDKLYKIQYSDYDEKEYCVRDLKTGKEEIFLSGKNLSNLFVTDGNKLYTTCYDTKEVYEVDLNTKEEKTIAKVTGKIDSYDYFYPLGCGSDYIIVGHPGFHNTVYSVNIKTGEITYLDSLENNASGGVYVYGENLFYLDRDDCIYQLNVSGEEKTALVENVDDAYFKGNTIYYAKIQEYRMVKDKMFGEKTRVVDKVNVMSYNIDTGKEAAIAENVRNFSDFHDIGFTYTNDDSDEVIQFYSGKKETVEGSLHSGKDFVIESNNDQFRLIFEDKKSVYFKEVGFVFYDDFYGSPCGCYNGEWYYWEDPGDNVVKSVDIEFE